MKRALDVDDVLAGFVPHAYNWFGKELKKVNYWDVPTMEVELGEGWFNKIANEEKFWSTLPVLSHPRDINFDFDYYLTSFPIQMLHLREKWLKEHGFPNKDIVVANDKLKACKELGVGVLIDDKPATIQSLQDSEIKGIHFINHYAGFDMVGDRIVTHLSQVVEFL